MRLQLTEQVRVEAGPRDGRIVARVWIGDREIPADAEVLAALGAVFAGQRSDAIAATLARRGILNRVDAAPITAPEGRITLRATLDLTLIPAEVTLPGPRGPVRRVVTPRNSLPIGLFVPPAWLAPIQDLDAQLVAGWMHMVRAAVSRGRTPDLDATSQVLAAFAREQIEADPALQMIFEVDAKGLVPLVALQTDAIQYPLGRVRFLPDRAVPPDRPPVDLTLAAQPGAGARPRATLGRFLGLLGGGTDGATVQGALDAFGSPLLTTLWAQLVGAGLVRPVARRRLADACPPGTIVHLGHATLLANLGGAHVLIDPWFVPPSRADASPPPAISDLPDLAAILFTHHHWDHVHLETLLQLPKDVPVVLPAQVSEAPLRPRTDLLLAELGFSDIRTLAHGAALGLGDGGEVVAAPFYGEDPTDIGYVGNTYVLRHGGAAAWVHVDSGTSRDGRSSGSTGTAARLREAYGPISPVFATRRQEMGTCIEHGWEFLLRPFAAWTQPTENCCNGADFLAALARSVEASDIVLYSEGGADWYPSGTDFLRGRAPRARDAVHEHLWEDADALRAAVEAVGARVTESRPWCRFRIGGGSDGEVLP